MAVNGNGRLVPEGPVAASLEALAVHWDRVAAVIRDTRVHGRNTAVELGTATDIRQLPFRLEGSGPVL